MKIRKKSAQKNAPLLAEFYTESQIENLAYQGYIFRHDDFDVWRVPFSICESLSVEFNCEDGFYHTIAKTIDGTKLYVTL